MRNLKKFLALVLALMMVVSVMVTVNAASTSSAAEDAAVKALQTYGVLKGYTDGLPHSEREITRAEMAALVYRIMTGDTTDSGIAKYSAYANKFTDVEKGAWYMGYIGFCASNDVLKGDPGKTVRPDEAITGFEVQAMLLRALGYDKNKEYTGNDWTRNVATDARKTGINTGMSFDSAALAPRGTVAQLTLNAATKADRVLPAVWPSIGYNSLGEKLVEVKDSKTYDDFGAPSTKYALTYTWPDVDVEDSKSVADVALATYYAPVTECDVATAASVKTSKTYDVYTNGKTKTGTQLIEATDRVNTIGAQGRWTRVFSDRIVYVDYYLATVGSVVTAVTDAAGHDIIPASEKLTIYNNGTTATVDLEGNPYADKTVLMVNVVGTVSGTVAAKNVTVVKELTASTVTVNAIKQSDNGANIGFIGTDGKTYLYNCTYGYPSNSKLSNTSIGSTWTVYTDNNGNVLGLTRAGSVAQYGVVTDAKVVEVGTGKWVARFTVLTKDGSSITLDSIGPNSHTPFVTQDLATDYALHRGGYSSDDTGGVDVLVKIDTDTAAATNGYPGYYVLTRATAKENRDTLVDAGNAEAIDNDGIASTLVNNNTVFFVANYQRSNAADGYVFTGYSVTTGFKSIQDLAVDVGAKIGGSTKKNLAISWFDGTTAGWAGYVLIENADKVSTNKVEKVDTYAYMMTANQFVDIYDGYYEYHTIQNGVDNQPVKIAYSAVSTIKAPALYVLDELTNNGYEAVKVPSTRLYADNSYSYSAGVLINTLHVYGDPDPAGVAAHLSGQHYITVADDARVYLINPTTGKSVSAGYDIATVIKTYAKTCELWYQLDEYGYADVIYVVEAGTTPTTTAFDVYANITITGNVDALRDVDNVTVEAGGMTGEVVSPATGTWGGAVTVADYYWEKLLTNEKGGSYWGENPDEVFLATGTYRLVVTFKITDADGQKSTIQSVRANAGTFTQKGNDSTVWVSSPFQPK